MAHDDEDDRFSRDRPLRIDPDAQSGSNDLPAFITRPEGAPVYYGFPIIDSSEVDGFRYGMITDFVADPETWGDGFVVAPDGSRAGLDWESEASVPYFEQMSPPEPGRWGVWAVGTPLPMRVEDDARAFLESLLPELRPRWEAWRADRPPSGGSFGDTMMENLKSESRGDSAVSARVHAGRSTPTETTTKRLLLGSAAAVVTVACGLLAAALATRHNVCNPSDPAALILGLSGIYMLALVLIALVISAVHRRLSNSWWALATAGVIALAITIVAANVMPDPLDVCTR